MWTRYQNGPCLIIALLWAGVTVAGAQVPAATPINNPEPCPTLSWDGLENNAAIVAAATNLATAMLRGYIANTRKEPDIGNQLGDFHEKLLGTMWAACVQKESPWPVPALSKSAQAPNSQFQATAQATTGQANKQVGAPPSSDGSTSAAEKVGIPQLLGIAVEDGAVTSNVTGTTMTLSTTPYGFFTAFGKEPDTQADYKKFSFFSQVGVSATFNVANSSDALASVTRKQVSQWQTKVTFRDTSTRASAVNEFYKTSGLEAVATKLEGDRSGPDLTRIVVTLDPLADAVYQKAWKPTLLPLVSSAPVTGDTGNSKQLAAIATAFLKALDQDEHYQTALKAASQQIDLSNNALESALNSLQADYQKYLELEPVFFAEVKNLTKGWNGDLAIGQNYPTTVTTSSTSSATPAIPAYLYAEVDWTCDPKKTPPSPSSTSEGTTPSASATTTHNAFAAKATQCFLFSNGSWTGNFSGNFYTNPNTALNEKTFRGVTAAVQAQWKLGPGLVKIKSANDDSQITLSLSGNYQRLQENKDQKSKRPDIVLGNVKLEIPISSGVSFPLSLSVANAAQQIKGTYVKGNFGVSFDLDKLASLLKANH